MIKFRKLILLTMQQFMNYNGDIETTVCQVCQLCSTFVTNFRKTHSTPIVSTLWHLTDSKQINFNVMQHISSKCNATYFDTDGEINESNFIGVVLEFHTVITCLFNVFHCF